MATRYLTALDYCDWHTDSVLRKHAKNRPLGQLEWRYQYTQRQPLLSCRTVHADASSGGGGSGAVRRAAVRSASSSSLLPEQQKVLQQLLENGGRAVASAPIRRSQGRNEGGQTTRNSNGQTARRGRPSTSLSTSSGRSRPRSTSSSCRSHSTGRPKSSSSRSSESFMVLTVDKDMLRTRQTYHQLTDRIHAHWRPGSSDLNQGHYRRGQKCPDDVPMATDAWLTFGGAMGEGAEGVVDTFANFKNPDTYYNIGGTVGSRVAQQLRKGDRIRIGINGEVVSHDLRVKKWVKVEKDPDEEQAPMKEQEDREEVEQDEEKVEEEEEVEEEEDTLEGVSESVQENPPSPASETEQEAFGELIVDAFDNLSDTLTEENDEEVEEKVGNISKENIAKVQDIQRSPDVPQRRPVPKAPFVDFPLNWDDQVTRPEVKVISPRRASSGDRKENLCETRPVVFHPHPSGRPPSRPRLASASPAHGYRIKQRPVSSSSTSTRHRHDSASTNKVRAITIDPNSEAEDQRLQEMSIEEVIQTRLEIAAATSPMQGTRSLSRSSLSSSRSPGRGEERGGGVARWSSASSPWQRSGREERGDGGPAALRSARSYPDRGGPHRATSSPSTRTPPIHPACEERRLGVPRPSSCVPMPGSARDVRDLGTMRPMVMSSRSTTSRAEPQGSGGRGPRPMTGLPQYRGPGSGGVSSIRSGGAVTGDAPRFIQISQPIRNPNTSRVPLVSGLRAFYYSPFAVNSMASSPVPPLLGFSSPPRSNTPENMLQGKVVERGVDGESLAALPRPLTPSAHGEASFQSSPKPDLAPGEASATVQTGVPPSAGSTGEPPKEAVMPGSDSDILATPQAPVHVIQAISIPTGNEVEEEEEEEGAESQRRERTADQSDL